MKITFDIQLTPAHQVSKQDWPQINMPLSDNMINYEMYQNFKRTVQSDACVNDSLLKKIFSFFHKDKTFEVPVIATYGFPQPFEAWTTENSTGAKIYFNLSLWTGDSLNEQGLQIIKHEISHILLKPLLPLVDQDNYLEQLDRIVIDEGISHFIGCPFDQTKLLTEHLDKWKSAETKLSEAIKLLRNSNLNKKDKTEIIFQSNTGPFWNKFGAIAGMMRAAWLYENQGYVALQKVIQNKSFSKLISINDIFHTN